MIEVVSWRCAQWAENENSDEGSEATLSQSV